MSLSLSQLKSNRFNSLVEIHRAEVWWERQPIEICQWLYSVGVRPDSVLDVGCGDGRWVSGIWKVFPDIRYMGIDLYKEHIDDCRKRFSRYQFICNDFLKAFIVPNSDLIIFAGTFNPKMDKETQTKMLEKAKKLSPKHILITFDYNKSGYPPHVFKWDNYSEIASYSVSEDNQDRKQHILAHLYKKNG